MRLEGAGSDVKLQLRINRARELPREQSIGETCSGYLQMNEGCPKPRKVLS